MPLSKEEIENRLGYHAGTEVTAPKHQLVREASMAFMSFLNEVLPDGREKSVAMTELETTTMWANKSVATLAPVIPLEQQPQFPILTTHYHTKEV